MGARLPNFLIAGAMKCGTTALAAYLREHPDAHVPEAKELEFFDREENFARGAEWYGQQFAGAGSERAVGEASPSYMCHPEGPSRMAQLLPEAKLIAMLRDPVDRAYSHYWHWRSRKGYETRPFDEAVAAEVGAPAPWETGRWEPSRPEGFHYLARGHYLPQLARLLEHYPRDALHVVLHEDFERDPGAVFREACAFLGIDPSFVPPSLGERFNSHYGYRRRRLWGLLIRLRAGRYLPRRASRALFESFREESRYPPMDAAVRARLAEHFAPANAELGRWLGRDLSHWGTGEPVG